MGIGVLKAALFIARCKLCCVRKVTLSLSALGKIQYKKSVRNVVGHLLSLMRIGTYRGASP